MALKAREDKEKKKDEKERNEKFKWVLKMITWETTINEKSIIEKYGQVIENMIADKRDSLVICREIKRKMLEG